MENISRKEAIEEVEKIIKSGTVPVVSLSIFDSLSQIKYSKNIENQLLYTLELCQEFVDELKKHGEEFQEQYLSALRKSDIVDNQSLEMEDSFLISLYYSMNSDFAIDKLINSAEVPLDKEKFVEYHDLLIKGSSSQDKTGLRSDNLKFVGKYVTNPKTLEKERKISYFPIDYRNIDDAVSMFLNYYNSILKENIEYFDILKPIIVHGLIAALQLFKDGNTRYGRLLQTVGLWESLNKELNTDFSLPFIYGTRQYAYSRGEYRNHISNLACNGTTEAWEDWILFNLKKIQDCIFYNEYNIKKLTSLLDVQESNVLKKI